MPGITLLQTPADVVSRWTGLIRQHPVTGRRVFDVQLAATMLGNGVDTIFTFNTGDFAPFAAIKAIRPS